MIKGNTVEFDYLGIGSHSWNNIDTPIHFSESAQHNRFAFTVQNKGTETVKFELVLGNKASLVDTDNAEAGGIRLNGKDGFQASISAGKTQTFVTSYTSAEVKCIALFIDSIDWDPNVPVTMTSGNIVFSNMAFFTEQTQSGVPEFHYSTQSSQYEFTAEQNGFHVRYTTTAWNTYAGVNVDISNYEELGSFNTLTFKVVNNSSTFTANYTVQILSDTENTKECEENGTLKSAAEICGVKVGKDIDYFTQKEFDLFKENVLQYNAEGKALVIMRPSETEPKIKVYLTAVGLRQKNERMLRAFQR